MDTVHPMHTWQITTVLPQVQGEDCAEWDYNFAQDMRYVILAGTRPLDLFGCLCPGPVSDVSRSYRGHQQDLKGWSSGDMSGHPLCRMSTLLHLPGHGQERDDGYFSANILSY